MSKLVLVVLCILWCEIAHGIPLHQPPPPPPPAFLARKHVDIVDFPYHVSVRRAGRHVCSGALVHESWIITAASCVYGSNVPRVSVSMGSSKLGIARHSFNVSKIVVHQTFDSHLLTSNIAMLKVKPSVNMIDPSLRPILLPSSENYHLKDGSLVHVSGWAIRPERQRQRQQQQQRQKTGAPPPAASAESDLESQLSVTGALLVNQRTCIRSMPSYKAVSGKMLCAANPNAGATCQGDLGAPLANDDVLLGILSVAEGCLSSSYPGLYTSVASFLPWIGKILQLHDYSD